MPRRKITTVAAALTAVALAAIGFGLWKRPRADGGRLPVDIYFTADTSGRIEPCGCFAGQYGGLSRVSTALKGAPEGALKVEIGNAIAGTEDFHVLQFGRVLGALTRLGYGAVNLGQREAALPAATLRKLAAESGVPLTSANVVDAATGEPLVRPHVIVQQRSGLRVAFIGVVDPQKRPPQASADVRVTGMAEALQREIAAVKGKADVLVALAFADEPAMEKLARDFYELAFVLGGDVRQPSTRLRRVNGTHLMATTNQSRALAEVHAIFDTGSRELADATGDVRLMEDRIPQDPEIVAFSADYRKAVRTTPLAVDAEDADAADRVPGVNVASGFAGSQSCAGCHAKAFATWEKSGHAHAFESLVTKDSDADPSCIGCHTIGFGEPGGYRRAMKAERLVDVGCESCHGPAAEHVRVRSTTPPGEPVLVKLRPVGQGQCLQCHHGEFSRPFKWEEFWPRVQHGKE